MTKYRDSIKSSHDRYLKHEYCPIRAGNIDGSSDYIHDGAILRALNSTYKTNKNLKSKPSCSIFVTISPKTSEETLLRHFNAVAKIKSCVIVRDIVTGISKGYGFIEVENEETVREVTKRMNKTIIDDFRIIVQKEAGRNMKGWKPRRLGGGFGGNRNSGQLRFGGIARPFEESSSHRSKSFEKEDSKRNR